MAAVALSTNRAPVPTRARASRSLFKTEAGLGSEVLIRHFAHWLLCQNKNSNEPLPSMQSCLLAQSGNHPDFHLLEPIENRDIGVDQVRDVLATLQRFAQQEGNGGLYSASRKAYRSELQCVVENLGRTARRRLFC